MENCRNIEIRDINFSSEEEEEEEVHIANGIFEMAKIPSNFITNGNLKEGFVFRNTQLCSEYYH